MKTPEIIEYALSSYGFTLDGQEGQTKTFKDLADAIEETYSTAHPVNRSVVETLKATPQTEIQMSGGAWQLKNEKLNLLSAAT